MTEATYTQGLNSEGLEVVKKTFYEVLHDDFFSPYKARLVFNFKTFEAAADYLTDNSPINMKQNPVIKKITRTERVIDFDLNEARRKKFLRDTLTKIMERGHSKEAVINTYQKMMDDKDGGS